MVVPTRDVELALSSADSGCGGQAEGRRVDWLCTVCSGHGACVCGGDSRQPRSRDRWLMVPEIAVPTREEAYVPQSLNFSR